MKTLRDLLVLLVARERRRRAREGVPPPTNGVSVLADIALGSVNVRLVEWPPKSGLAPESVACMPGMLLVPFLGDVEAQQQALNRAAAMWSSMQTEVAS